MDFLTLTEYRTTHAGPLSLAQREALRKVAPSVMVTPTAGCDGHYDLIAGCEVGAICLPDLAIQIRPKIPIDRVLFLVSYALDPERWRSHPFSFGCEPALFEALILGFLAQLRHAFRRGVLQGYRTEEAALDTVRGRIRFDQQARARYGLFPPIEVRYDEFTEDIDVNRIIKAAIRRLGYLQIRSEQARRSLCAFESMLTTVSAVEYDSQRLPNIQYDRLNGHYRPAVELSKLILRSVSFDLSHGRVQSASFLIDMNQVFENFVVIALRESLNLRESLFRQHAPLHLDEARRIKLEPDMSWWEGKRCTFVGDAKYKCVGSLGISHSDLYQLLAYSTACDLPSGLLIYAAGEGEPVVHKILHAGKELHVMTLDLTGSPDAIIGQIQQVAARVVGLRAQVYALSGAHDSSKEVLN
jgi:5-methylcytosine-specific restriction enzyme subunit McrC